MSYPKETCNILTCQWCQKDPQYTKKVCEYPKDIEEAKKDKTIDKNCPWIQVLV